MSALDDIDKLPRCDSLERPYDAHDPMSCAPCLRAIVEAQAKRIAELEKALHELHHELKEIDGCWGHMRAPCNKATPCPIHRAEELIFK